MASNAISAQGTVFRVGDGLLSSTDLSYTDVAELLDLSGPSEDVAFTEVTPHGSSRIERITQIPDSGEVTFSLNFLPDTSGHGSGSSGLRGLLRDQTKRAFRVAWPTTGTQIDEFDGWVSGFEPSAPVNDRLTADVSVQIADTITSTTST